MLKIGNLEVYGVIYKITNKVNNKVYIGQTKQGIKKRYNYKGNSYIEKIYNYYECRKRCNQNYNKHLVNAIEKYKFTSFDVNEIIDIAFSKEELDIKEQCWISIYDSFKNGYNKNIGGGSNSGYKATLKTRIKISDSSKKKLEY